MADSIRVPTSTVSLISLNLTFRSLLSETGEPLITRDFINDVFRKAANGPQKDFLLFSENQNVSSDLLGCPAAVVIEGCENHTRTGFLTLNAEILQQFGLTATQDINFPVTHAKIFGWYDNEFGCYVNCLGKLTKYLDKNMI